MAKNAIDSGTESMLTEVHRHKERKMTDVKHLRIKIDKELYERIEKVAEIMRRDVHSQVLHMVEQGVLAVEVGTSYGSFRRPGKPVFPYVPTPEEMAE